MKQYRVFFTVNGQGISKDLPAENVEAAEETVREQYGRRGANVVITKIVVLYEIEPDGPTP